ncbi:unnamed protein product [Symbiodinium natans]|uniref:Uncharacterized protein n=1 Tax=Symbiodinium natans TaxID=878477 RepID=A0A812PXE1_9DINO|nr:unnamed protein product [Symbiodinium natans]
MSKAKDLSMEAAVGAKKLRKMQNCACGAECRSSGVDLNLAEQMASKASLGAQEVAREMIAEAKDDLVERLKAFEEQGRSQRADLDTELQEFQRRLNMQDNDLKRSREKSSQVDLEFSQLTNRVSAVRVEVSGLKDRAEATEAQVLQREAAAHELARRLRETQLEVEVQSESLRRVQEMPAALCLPAALLLALTASAARISAGTRGGDHPSLSLPSSARVDAQVTSDGTLKWTSKGNVSYTFTDLLFLTAVSDHVLTFPEGQRGTVERRRTTFVGWNNLVTRTVTRYLFVAEYGQGKELRAECFTYQRQGPSGYIDPFSQVESNFDLVHEGPGEAFWKTPQLSTPHGSMMSGRKFTEVGGKNTMNATIVSTEKHHKTTYTAVYSDHVPSAVADHDDLIYKYRETTCTEVSGFQNIPAVCVDDLLAIEYGCDYVEH